VAKQTKKQRAAAAKRGAAKRKRNNPKKKNNNKRKSMWGKITTAAVTVAGLDNIAGHDMGDSSGAPLADRAKNFINAAVGRTTGFNPIPNTPYNYDQQVSVEGMFNKYTGMGFFSWVYGNLPIKALPYKSQAKSFGKKMSVVGAITGIFKPQSHGSHSHNSHKTIMPALRAQSNGPVVTTQ